MPEYCNILDMHIFLQENVKNLKKKKSLNLRNLPYIEPFMTKNKLEKNDIVSFSNSRQRERHSCKDRDEGMV